MVEKTLVLIKPDGVERKLIGKIIHAYESKNLEISHLKMLHADISTVESHYEEHKGRDYFHDLVNYILEDKIVAMVIQGEHAIELVRNINGATDPLVSDLGSIRGRYGNSKQRNLVHSSDCQISAEREIKIWFPEII